MLDMVAVKLFRVFFREFAVGLQGAVDGLGKSRVFPLEMRVPELIVTRARLQACVFQRAERRLADPVRRLRILRHDRP